MTARKFRVVESASADSRARALRLADGESRPVASPAHELRHAVALGLGSASPAPLPGAARLATIAGLATLCWAAIGSGVYLAVA